MEPLVVLWSKSLITLSYIPGMWRLRLMRYVPGRHAVFDYDETVRLVYTLERGVYRTSHYMERQGATLDKRSYSEYKAIAKKYGWPFIAEAYDKAPDAPLQPIGRPRIVHRAFYLAALWQNNDLLRAWIQLDILITILVVGNMWINDVPILAEPGEALLAGFGVVLLMQILFAIPYVVFRLLAATFRTIVRLWR